MKPQTLLDIYKELLDKRFLLGLTCFRVRDTSSLMDYLICNTERWKWAAHSSGLGVPRQMWGLLLEPSFNCYYPMDCQDESFALLSSTAELQYFRLLGSKAVPDIVRASYR